MNFHIRDLVMAYLKRERFPKLKLKKIGPCKNFKEVFCKFLWNWTSFWPSDFTNFNVLDSYPFRDEGIQPDGVTSDRDDPTIDSQGQIPKK